MVPLSQEGVVAMEDVPLQLVGALTMVVEVGEQLEDAAPCADAGKALAVIKVVREEVLEHCLQRQ